MRSDQSNLSFWAGHCHVQLTGIDMHNFTIDGNKLVKFKLLTLETNFDTIKFNLVPRLKGLKQKG